MSVEPASIFMEPNTSLCLNIMHLPCGCLAWVRVAVTYGPFGLDLEKFLGRTAQRRRARKVPGACCAG